VPIVPALLRGLPLLLPPSLGTQPARPDLEKLLAVLGTDQYEIRSPLTSLWFDIACGKGWSVGPRSFLSRSPDGTVAQPAQGLSVPLAVSMGWMAPGPPLVYNVLGVLRQVADGPLPAAAAEQVQVQRPNRIGVSPGFELRLLRAFLTVVDAGSIGAAARTMGLTQGAVSRQIDRLEHVLGCPVLVRSAGGVRTTPAGAVLARQGPELLAQLTSGIDTARRAARGIRGRCTLARVSTEMTRTIIVGIMEDLVHRLPDVVVDVVEVMSPEQPARLREGTIDLGLVHAMLPREATAGLGRLMVVPDPLECALLPADHPLATRSMLLPHDLMSETFLLPPRAFQPSSTTGCARRSRGSGWATGSTTATRGSIPSGPWCGAAG
jgi:molybdate transport repressor ModE-like protein